MMVLSNVQNCLLGVKGFGSPILEIVDERRVSNDKPISYLQNLWSRNIGPKSPGFGGKRVEFKTGNVGLTIGLSRDSKVGTLNRNYPTNEAPILE